MKYQVSRRAILSGTAAIVATSSISSFASSSLQSFENRGSSSALVADDRSVRLLASDDPEFVSLLDANYPGLRQDPFFRQIAPATGIVVPTHGPDVWAFTATWRFLGESSSYEIPLSYYSLPGSKRTSHPGRTVSSGGRWAIKQGSIRLISPFFTMSPSLFQAAPRLSWRRLIPRREPNLFLARKLQTAQSISLGLDAVIFADSRYLGADHYHLARLLEATRNGERDEALVIQAALHNNLPNSNILQQLAQDASSKRSSSKLKQQYLREESQRRYAAFLLSHFRKGGRSGLSSVLTQMERQPVTSITKMSA